MKGGNLREFLKNKNSELDLSDKLTLLLNIAQGLKDIHKKNLVHRDLHSGNILNFCSIKLRKFKTVSYITDLGLSQPASYQKQEGKIFGVLPYVAPEVLQGQPYTQVADIYSFGMVAYELLANAYPYYDFEGDETKLALNIYADPKKRPNVEYLDHEEYNTFSQNTPYQIHSIATTTSQLINTQQIAQLFQEAKQQALAQELKHIEALIDQPLTDEQKELVSDFIQTKKLTIQDEADEQAEDQA
ncbi:15280_t:CDS:2 [Funneliformis geosporum]|uniref:15280_t:CDS:1 n=1 Tax=Funneliformis geosporum TaxID=1117311 RepID=A0A9W4SAS9_9GLOM|nr:15280_t:CDS:2 [Funneliformis geosporum]